ncbi:hypothetical protein TAMA11512_16710 [Selenomonas sp. TAMA-11512]|uniref:hypothetical protein n=1 Tax=Selenomonas sp. TAMA-11512 TaxID=3095337 RepID=UPI00308F10AD|nr:hypothetical protein TAMA11512_16710 [Selenomonas sp. TAMA-11512]
MPLVDLPRNEKGDRLCPICAKPLKYMAGGDVKIVGGKVNLDDVKPRYVCEDCNSYYIELLKSGYFEEYEGEKQEKPVRHVKAVSELQPVMLKADDAGHAVCPRCAGTLDWVDGVPVQIVDGKADMRNVEVHFHCQDCDSIFRKIAGTDYFQYSED